MKGDIQHSTSIRRAAHEKFVEVKTLLSGVRQQQWWSLAVVGLALAGAIVTTLSVRNALSLGDSKLPTIAEMNRGIMIFDKNDKYVCTLRAEADRQAVPLSKISLNMRNAIVAAEDRRFFTHHGVDPIGITRAFFRNQEAGRIVEGGSTITQQVVKNLYLDKRDRSYQRKIKEALIAWNIESQYSKNKILETYLNVVYFGGGVCGVERAAQHYFNKHADNLTVAESAYLAALVKAPSDFSDAGNRKRAVERQREILADMQECNYVTREAVKAANQEKLAFRNGPTSRPWPHYVGCVEDVLQRELGDQMWAGSWKVYTNLDIPAQKLAEATVNQGVATAPKGINQGALVTQSLKDGAVLAIVGGAGKYEDTQWNRAIHPHTAGSAFKPFVYLAGLAQGIIQPDTMIDDSPLVIESPFSKPYSPKNYDGRFCGWISARNALAQSRNICSIRVAQATGMGRVVEMAYAAGIRSQLDEYPALALGCCAVTPMDMATAYGTIARGGVYMPPQVVRRIAFESGRTYREYHATPSSNLPSEATLQLVDVLQDVVKCGTGTRARLAGVAVGGKTGTSNDSKDIWFCGFTPDTVTAVWAGNDLNKPVQGARVTGGVVMAKIWHDYMAQFVKNHPPVHLAFTKPGQPLIYEVPRYADNQLLTEGYVTAYDQFGNVQTYYDSSKAATSVTNVEELEKASKAGIARAYDLQKLNAIKRLRGTNLVADAGSNTYKGVANYGYDQNGNFVNKTATNSFASSTFTLETDDDSNHAPVAAAVHTWYDEDSWRTSPTRPVDALRDRRIAGSLPDRHDEDADDDRAVSLLQHAPLQTQSSDTSGLGTERVLYLNRSEF